ncbi:MAG TPA: response regulator [Polyangiaceae bacterium]|jgi:CheY-like chemotaxis protein
MMDSRVVLIVDDDEDIRSATRSVLEDEGYTVDVAPDGLAALRRLHCRPRPALLLLDLMMPVMNGETLLRTLESKSEFRELPVVIFTAASPTAETSGLRYPLLRKPFSVQSLLELVTTYLPRFWDDDETTTNKEIPALLRDTPRAACAGCSGRASIRCAQCGVAFCSRCFGPGHGGRCVQCALSTGSPRQTR